jgi:hypothetical protein
MFGKKAVSKPINGRKVSTCGRTTGPGWANTAAGVVFSRAS